MMCIKKQSYKNITFLIISPQPSIATFLRFYVLLFISTIEADLQRRESFTFGFFPTLYKSATECAVYLKRILAAT